MPRRRSVSPPGNCPFSSTSSPGRNSPFGKTPHRRGRTFSSARARPVGPVATQALRVSSRRRSSSGPSAAISSLRGAARAATLYAVYTFLEDIVGCRWWTSTASRMPRRPSLSVGQPGDPLQAAVRVPGALLVRRFRRRLGGAEQGQRDEGRRRRASGRPPGLRGLRPHLLHPHPAGKVLRRASRVVQRDRRAQDNGERPALL